MDAAVFRAPRRRLIAIDGATGPGEVAALEFGPQDRPIDVVFVHANGFNAQTYTSLLAPLSAGLRVLAIDQRGHGATPLPVRTEGRRSWLDLRDDLLGVLRTLDGPPVVLAGHSMGGTVSLLAAAARPEAVKGLVLFDPVIMPRLVALYARAPWTSGVLWKKMPIALAALRRRAVFDSREAVVAAYTGRGAFRTWPETMLVDYVDGGFIDRDDGKVELACAPAWESSNYSAQAHDPWRAVRRVTGPVRILRAETGSTCRAGDSFAQRGKDVIIETVAGTSHFLPMERPDLARDAIFSMATG
ncbi:MULTISPECIES: alpha/beta fold hydrolase [unclassified Caulobacter]|uniref:alpha/beta fold hydrolase n=1 Tax=unclassified Caulobacter TaxID=2648921 RepID=UPI000D35DC36|nr:MULTISPECIES: alpha/beta hydrolase [unclassified Caulobacter]PTS83891.1 alpha/beta hydrolase [Caulobacter sp. HMWF009]PTT05020.1 alpha/beta hydrolase [Caulobacter sp. HMWF025]